MVDNNEDFSLEENIIKNGSLLSGFAVPNEILIKVFGFLSEKDLINNIPLVCHHWNVLSKDYHLWIYRLHKRGVFLSKKRLDTIRSTWSNPKTIVVVQFLCLFNNYFHHNLLKNSSGQDRFKHWHLSNRSVKIENPPIGSDPIPEEANLPTQHCFAASHSLVHRMQKIKLKENLKITTYALKLLKPSIQVSEWVSARWDCGSQNEIEIILVGINKLPPQRKIYSAQWIDTDFDRSKWHRMNFEVKYEDFPKDLSEILYCSRGKDTQFWAGNYGPKTAGSSVVLNIAT